MLVTEDASGPDIPDPEELTFVIVFGFVFVIVIVFLLAVTTEDTSVPDIPDLEKPVQPSSWKGSRLVSWCIMILFSIVNF